MVKKETVALAIIILGFLALMAGPYNNDATNDLSSTEIQKGELSVTEAWWSARACRLGGPGGVKGNVKKGIEGEEDE